VYEQRGGYFKRRLVDKTATLFVRSDQRLDFAAQLLVSRARPRNEQAALLGAMRDRRVEDFFDLLPALRCHGLLDRIYKILQDLHVNPDRSCKSCKTSLLNMTRVN